MSASDTCLPSNPDTSGIGVRTAIYAQNLLSFIPALFALQDGKVTPLELEALETQSTTILITAFAILLSVIVQALQHGLTNYHAAIILNLSWMNNTNLFIYFILHAYHTFELRDEEMKQGGDPRTLRAFWVSRMKKTMRNPVLVIGSAHLSLMSAVGIWLWVQPIAFGNSPPCSLGASLFVVGQRALIGSQGLREWSLLIYSLLLIPGLNLIVPIGFFAAPIWVYSHLFPFSLKQESRLRFARAGLAMLAIINVVLLADTEVAISKNQGLTAKGDGDWTFGQTLALLLLLIPMRDIGEALLERRAKKVGERLKAASEVGELGAVRDAIKSGAQKSVMAPSITIAFKKGHLDVVEVLIESARDVEAIYPSLQLTLAGYSQGELDSTLCSGARNQQVQVVRLLVKLGGGINAIGSDNQTALHYAAEKGHTEIVKVLADLKADLNLQDSSEGTALQYAAENGHTEIVKVLADLKADLNLQDKYGRTALYLAVVKGHTEIVKVLADLKADLNLQISYGRRTALHYAAEKGHTEIVKVLADLKADLNLQDSDGWTALYLAVVKEHTEIIKVLADLKADLNLQNLSGGTALHYAAEKGHTEIIKALADLKADPNLQDSYWKRTALHYAAEKGHTEIVKVLADLKADLNLQDSSGGTALHYAAENGHTEIVKVLADLKADPNLQDSSGGTALYLAAENGHTEIVKALADLKADPNLQDSYWKRTALHYAAEKGHTEIVKVLADLKADFNLQDSSGVTAFHYAAKNGHTEIVKVLADLKIDLNLQDLYWKRTALHYAAEKGHFEIVKVLADLKADPNFQDKHGRTALHLAHGQGHTAIVSFLAKLGVI
ncbi:hypothetical protein D9756_004562 [Leucocoprinus leucothites]|uniref:Uncharacterized protein n=1 Tax=Leucocoprinus leucothites TaxID=201217 RepID=A0A8H5G9I8_9AGAR|nr:hypothetical protein D9756_004562 [Leucoagaricus leucothites]